MSRNQAKGIYMKYVFESELNCKILSSFWQILSAPFHRSSKRWNLLFSQWERWAPLLFFNREPDLVNKKDLEAVEQINRKFFRADHETSIPAFNEQNLRLLEQIFSTAVFQAPLCRDLDLMVSPILKQMSKTILKFHDQISSILVFNKCNGR